MGEEAMDLGMFGESSLAKQSESDDAGVEEITAILTSDYSIYCYIEGGGI